MKTVTVTLTDEQVACLEHDLISIEEWIQGAIDGKISNCRDRMVAPVRSPLAVNLETGKPYTDSELVGLIVGSPGYLNRKQREDLAEAQRLAEIEAAKQAQVKVETLPESM